MTGAQGLLFMACLVIAVLQGTAAMLFGLELRLAGQYPAPQAASPQEFVRNQLQFCAPTLRICAYV